eukprot:g36601.t1
MVDGESQEGYVDILGYVNVKEEELLNILKSIKVDKSQGPDGIYPRMLREVSEEIDGNSYGIFVSPLVTGEIPEDRRIAKAVPLFKKGNKDYSGNQRLVSL